MTTLGMDDIGWPALRELCEAHLQLCEAARARLLPGDGAAYMKQVEEPARDRLGDVVFADPWAAQAELARLRAGLPPWGALLAAAGAEPGQAEEDEDEAGHPDDLGPWDDQWAGLAALARELGPAGAAAEIVGGLSASQKAGLLLALGGDGASMVALAYPRTADVHPAGEGHPADSWNLPSEPAVVHHGVAENSASGRMQSRPPRSKALRRRRAAQARQAMRRARQAHKFYGRRAA